MVAPLAAAPSPLLPWLGAWLGIRATHGVAHREEHLRRAPVGDPHAGEQQLAAGIDAPGRRPRGRCERGGRLRVTPQLCKCKSFWCTPVERERRHGAARRNEAQRTAWLPELTAREHGEVVVHLRECRLEPYRRRVCLRRLSHPREIPEHCPAVDVGRCVRRRPGKKPIVLFERRDGLCGMLQSDG